MLTLILALKTVLEIAAMALLGRTLLGLLAGARREHNLAYQLLDAAARPAVWLARRLTPGFVLERHLPLVAFLLLGFAWLAVTVWKVSHCQAIGVAACL
jgi:hypothetical protein